MLLRKTINKHITKEDRPKHPNNHHKRAAKYLANLCNVSFKGKGRRWRQCSFSSVAKRPKHVCIILCECPRFANPDLCVRPPQARRKAWRRGLEGSCHYGGFIASIFEAAPLFDPTLSFLQSFVLIPSATNNNCFVTKYTS